ncbi:MAG TPA: family 43 glycosylhydrolase [Nocardioides sp.]|nr:family 43 glycosylhydrolase [Nocardioides sp.]
MPRPGIRLAVLTALVMLAPLVPAATVAAADPDRYRNPLAPRIPDGGTVDSCADPAVIRGQGDDRGWYLYCTTDPLNDEDLDEQGDLRFHPIPMMRSRDLVNWRYVGDALPADRQPEWAAEGAGIWAPDVVYSRATDRYYMTFVVTDTDDDLPRPPGGCASTGDSAIGVAVSDNPTGPWDVSEQPVVGPRPDLSSQDRCDDYYWTFDPDVLGTSVGAKSVLYFGSYYGGVHAVDVVFTEDGMAAVTADTDGDGHPGTRVVIGNRYEGTHVVRRHGWYYLFGSATNCCNGPLTAYGVFAGRSESPKGPFVDRDGRSLLDGRVGGTPVVLPNGNRWVGVGHNTVVRDRAGDWWTLYHAADRFDPYFETEPGFTKRPALLDRLTWRDGWPEVRAGRWASDGPVPAPATTRRDSSEERLRPPAPLRPGRPMPAFSDDFAGGLERAWRWVRRPAATEYDVNRGRLRWDTHAGDLARETNSAPVLVRPMPDGNFVVETRVRLNVPPEGCCHNFVQAGLVLYDDDERYLKLVHASLWETRQTEWAKEVPPEQAEHPPHRYGNGVVGPPAETTRLRVVVQRRAGQDKFTAFTRSKGGDWVRGGVWRHSLGSDADIGLLSMGGEGFTARFSTFRTWKLATRRR